MQQQLALAAKMYKCQETAKALYKEKYPEKMAFYAAIIRAAQAKYQLAVIPAIMKILEDKEMKNNGIVIMLLLAAAVEVIESPTQSSPAGGDVQRTEGAKGSVSK